MTIDEFLDAFRATHQKFPAYVYPSGRIRHIESRVRPRSELIDPIEERAPIAMMTLHHYGLWPAKGGPSQLHNCAWALGLDMEDAYNIERAADGYNLTKYQEHIRHRMMDIINTPTTEKSNDNSN